MSAMKILMALGNVKDTYILSAEDFRQGKPQVKNGRLPTRRLWLLAAAIALSLILLGCAIAYALGVQDLAFGQKQQEYYDGSSQTVTLLSIQGMKGTPGYQATKEWHDWLETYDPDMAIYHSEEAFSEDFGEEYWDYNLYSREMKDKLDEICQKYGLELMGKMYTEPDVEAGYQALGIFSVFRPGIQAEAGWRQIGYYANGSFRLEDRVTLEGQIDRIVTFRCNRKNAFSELYVSVGPEGTYEEWVYTTSYGVDVLMVLDHGGVRGNATMYAECGDYVYLLTISEFEDSPLPDRTELEAYAESFDFSLQPQPVAEEDMAAAEEHQEEANRTEEKEYYYALFRVNKDNHTIWHPREGYDTSIAAYLTYVKEHDDGRRTCYALWDIDGDGEEEVFLGKEDGDLIEMLKMEDGVVSIRFCDHVCQGNVLEDFFTYGFYPNGETTTRREGSGHVYKDIDGTVLAYLLYDEETDTWREGSKYWDSAMDITREQAQEIIAKYPRIELEMQPISQYTSQ